MTTTRARDFSLALIWLAVDQTVKGFAVTHLENLAAPVTIIPGFFQLILSHNRGGLFGWLGTASEPWRTVLLTGLPILAVIVIAVILARMPLRDVLGRIGLALVLGGAAGNVADRLIYGHVVDFFDIYTNWAPAARALEFFFRVNHWPTFNVADVGLTTGAALLIFGGLRRRKPAEDETHAPVSS